jgi:putative transposase
VCGRTACTVRGGGGRKPGQSALPRGTGASRRPYIEHATRRVHIAGMSENPDGAWTTQQARNFLFSLPERDRPLEYLVCENDGKFTRAFDTVFNTEGIGVIHTPVRASKAKRGRRAIRRDPQTRVPRLAADHQPPTSTARAGRVGGPLHGHRPHRALELAPPEPRHPPRARANPPAAVIHRHDRLGGLIHEYTVAA